MENEAFSQYEIIDKDEVLKMARQAGGKGLHLCTDPTETTIAMRLDFEQLEAFAKLVADVATAKERERLTDAAMKAAEKAIDIAIALEREACAKLIEDYKYWLGRTAKEDIAREIRARSGATSRGEAT
jgi:hypothetical protein